MSENIYIRFLKLLQALFLIFFMIPSCRSDEEKNLIPEKTFAAILTDIHFEEGLMMIPEFRDKYSERDSVINYMDIIENHGYTKEAMDRTLKYYFTRKPKSLMKIYDHAIGKLTELEILLAEDSETLPPKAGDLWKGEPVYYLSDEPETERIFFDHIFYLRGDYKLQFSATVYPSDESSNPCFTAWTCNADSTDTGKRTYYPSIKYIKDGYPHQYMFIFRNQEKFPVILKGWLFDSENNPAGVSRYARIENISFFFTPRAL